MLVGLLWDTIAKSPHNQVRTLKTNLTSLALDCYIRWTVELAHHGVTEYGCKHSPSCSSIAYGPCRVFYHQWVWSDPNRASRLELGLASNICEGHKGREALSFLRTSTSGCPCGNMSLCSHLIQKLKRYLNANAW